MPDLLQFVFIVVVLGALYWAWTKMSGKQLGRGFATATGGDIHFVKRSPPAPFDRLFPGGPLPQIPQLVQATPSGGEAILWQDPQRLWGPSTILVVVSHPHERAYHDTIVLLSVDWAPTGDDRTIRQSSDLVRRLHLEGRDLQVGHVWQSYQVLCTNPEPIEARLPDDLPRTGADAAYEQLNRVVMVYRYTVGMFEHSSDPAQLRRYLALTQGLADSFNARLGPPPSPFV